MQLSAMMKCLHRVRHSGMHAPRRCSTLIVSEGINRESLLQRCDSDEAGADGGSRSHH